MKEILNLLDETGQNRQQSMLHKTVQKNIFLGMPSSLPLCYMAIVKQAQEQADRHVIDVKATAIKANIGVSTVWRDVKLGVFVPPIRLSQRRVAFVAAEVDALLSAKALMTRSGQIIDLKHFIAVLTAPSYKNV